MSWVSWGLNPAEQMLLRAGQWRHGNYLRRTFPYQIDNHWFSLALTSYHTIHIDHVIDLTVLNVGIFFATNNSTEFYKKFEDLSLTSSLYILFV